MLGAHPDGVEASEELAGRRPRPAKRWTQSRPETAGSTPGTAGLSILYLRNSKKKYNDDSTFIKEKKMHMLLFLIREQTDLQD